MAGINIIKHTRPGRGDIRIAIVASRYNDFVVDRLYNGARKTLNRHGIEDDSITLVQVPGAFEIPVAVKSILDRKEFDAVITLGAIIRGETPHFDYIAGECARGIAGLSVDTGIPVIFGVLTVDHAEQALNRAGEEDRNKGSEAALAALEMVGVLEQLHS